MMGHLGEKISSVAELVLKRRLSEEEELEIYKISDVLGMGNVQSFLHQILVFKMHEDTMKKQFEQLAFLENRLDEKFTEMGTLADRIDGTLKASVERILGDGATKVGQDMGIYFAEKAKETLGARDDYQFLRGQLCITCLMGIIATLAYWLGTVNALETVHANPTTNTLSILFILPAGWWVFFSWSLCTFMWAYDHWKLVKKSSFHKSLFVLQCFVTVTLDRKSVV
jgi:hypothetical protein